MIKRIIVLILILGVVLSTASANYWTYQENATATDEIGIWFVYHQVIDAKWNTYGSSGFNLAEHQANYTKPGDAIGAKWRVKDNGAETNLTIPDDCWNAFSDKLVLRIQSNESGNSYVNWTCYNGTAWESQRLYTGGTNWVYEEGVWWERTGVPEFSDLGWILAAVLGAGGFILVRKKRYG